MHSLSKRSNLAGVRAGFYAGDPELVTYLLDVRRHAGLMVPGPGPGRRGGGVRRRRPCGPAARRYGDRLAFLADALALAGLPVALPAGGFYLWVPVPDRFADGWALCDWLAREAGLLVSPGELYGPDGSGHVRVAVVQPLDRLGAGGRATRLGGLTSARSTADRRTRRLTACPTAVPTGRTSTGRRGPTGAGGNVSPHG